MVHTIKRTSTEKMNKRKQGVLLELPFDKFSHNLAVTSNEMSLPEMVCYNHWTLVNISHIYVGVDQTNDSGTWNKRNRAWLFVTLHTHISREEQEEPKWIKDKHKWTHICLSSMNGQHPQLILILTPRCFWKTLTFPVKL